MSNVLTVFAALLAGLTLASPATSLSAQQAVDCPDVDQLTAGMDPALAHIRYLADDALEGRGAGTNGARCAAQYIADQFEAIGLAGAGPNGSYFQAFPIPAGVVLGAGSTLRTPQSSYTLSEDWIPFGYSASAAITGTLLYGGDGINRPGDPDNEYPTLDITGRIVVVEDGDLRAPLSQALQTDAHFKASVAAGRDAGGMIVLLGDGRALPDLSGETRAALGIPVAAVRGDAADRIRQAARRGDRVFLAASVQPRAVEARNVAALLPGSDPTLADEVLIIGAHYDHLGFGGEGSLDPDVREVHNGADDNASGTSGLIEIARALSESDRRPARSVLFLAFTGEEKGLWGSSHYVRNPLLPIERTVAMLNMDMIGRLEGGTLIVHGVGTAEEWTDVLLAANQSTARPLSIATTPEGFGPSDHASFYGEGLPVLHFFSNTHVDYHRPSDDWEKIDIEGLGRIVDLVIEVAFDLAGVSGSDERIALTPIEPDLAAAHGQDPSASTTGGGYGPYLGTIPDMVPVDSGLRLTGVREGSPAAIAGIRGGDVVVEFGGNQVGDIYTYTYALQEHEPGDSVEIVVLRDGERLTFTAVLGDRR
ncbi:MAG: M28 family peptidase [Gemmatimonadetes bacterium]|nr:M28 family peptidase [Gemmatimonadota bacterium]